MKKKLIYSALVLTAAAVLRADLRVDSPNAVLTKADGVSRGKVVFADGGKLSAEGGAEALEIRVEADAKGVLSTMADGTFFLGGGGGVSVSGAGKGASALTFDGCTMAAIAYGDYGNFRNFSFNGLTFNMLRNPSKSANRLVGAEFAFTNCNINILKPAGDGSPRVCEFSTKAEGGTAFKLVNSKLAVERGATLELATHRTDKLTTPVVADAGSSVEVGGTLSLRTGYIALEGASLTVEEGGVLDLSNAPGYEYEICKVRENALRNANPAAMDPYMAGKIRMGAGSRLTLNSSNLDGRHGYRAAHAGAENDINIGGGNAAVYLAVNAPNRLNFTVSATGGTTTARITLGKFEYNKENFLLRLDYLVWSPGSENFYGTNVLSDKGGFYFDFANFADYAVVFLKDNIEESVMGDALSHFLIDGQSGLVDFRRVRIKGADYWALVKKSAPVSPDSKGTR